MWDSEYDDTGWSAMLAAKREWRNVTGLVELLHVSSKRQDREEVGLNPRQRQTQLQAAIANALVTILAAGAFTVCRLIFVHGAHCPARAGACRRSVAARRGAALGARRRFIGPSGARRRCDLLPRRFGRPGSARRGRFVVSQRNIQFHPFLTIVPVGADVSFPNLDPTKHHVYSFSPAKRFELKLFARDQSRTVHFDKPGVVALGCNIHDR